MQLPTINNNGTAPSDLHEQHLETMKHVRRAIEAVQGASKAPGLKADRRTSAEGRGSRLLVGHDRIGKRAGQASSCQKLIAIPLYDDYHLWSLNNTDCWPLLRKRFRVQALVIRGAVASRNTRTR